MKLMSVTVPLLIVALTVAAVGGLGLLAVRASAFSTRTSIDLLRMNLRVARLHEELLRHSRNALAAQVETLLPRGSVPAAVAGPEARKADARKAKVFMPLEASPVRPWPEAAAEPAEVRP
jgi:hypothetical protein